MCGGIWEVGVRKDDVTVNDDICGLCGQPGADKIPHSNGHGWVVIADLIERALARRHHREHPTQHCASAIRSYERYRRKQRCPPTT